MSHTDGENDEQTTEEPNVWDVIAGISISQAKLLSMLVEQGEAIKTQQQIIMGQQEMLVAQHGMLMEMCEKAFGVRPIPPEKPKPALTVVADEGAGDPSAA